jgi:hypothetical protein
VNVPVSALAEPGTPPLSPLVEPSVSLVEHMADGRARAS